MTESLLSLDSVSIGFESQIVLRGICLDLPRTGCVGILGPGGVGKSTLLRSLARWNDVLPSFWLHGRVELDGRDFFADVDVDEGRRLLSGVRCPGVFTGSSAECLEERSGRAYSVMSTDELSALSRLGCKYLVSLTEDAFSMTKLEGHGIRGWHFPIVDMCVPTNEAMLRMCKTLSDWVDDGVPAVVHCRAGLGRTGTVLACVLIYRDENAVRAIEVIRAINNYYIQSREQSDFVTAFEAHVATQRA